MDMRAKRIYIDPADLEIMICGIATISDALIADAYSGTANSILDGGERTASKFIARYYDITRGVLELMAGATSLMSSSLANGELSIILEEEDS